MIPDPILPPVYQPELLALFNHDEVLERSLKEFNHPDMLIGFGAGSVVLKYRTIVCTDGNTYLDEDADGYVLEVQIPVATVRTIRSVNAFMHLMNGHVIKYIATTHVPVFRILNTPDEVITDAVVKVYSDASVLVMASKWGPYEYIVDLPIEVVERLFTYMHIN